jgi:hypothetical protein
MTPDILILEIGEQIKNNVIRFLKKKGLKPEKLEIKTISIQTIGIETPSLFEEIYNFARKLSSKRKNLWIFLPGRPIGFIYGLGELMVFISFAEAYWKKVTVYQFSKRTFKQVLKSN